MIDGEILFVRKCKTSIFSALWAVQIHTYWLFHCSVLQSNKAVNMNEH